MRRDLVIAIVGGAAIVIATVGLVTGALREGPLETGLEPVVVPVVVEGEYHARGDTSTAPGVCLEPPCAARTTVDVRFEGLPRAPYEVHLAGGAEDVPLSATFRGNALEVRYDRAVDHRDQDTLVLSLAGRPLVVVPVEPSAEPMTVDGAHQVVFASGGGSVRANEIGGVHVSTVVKGEIDATPPEGWRYHAWFDGLGGPVDLGVFVPDGGRMVLDERIERLRLEDQDTFVVYVEPVDAEPTGPSGFPVLGADV